MKPKNVTIDGEQVLIKPMDAGYLMADQEPTGLTVSVGCRACAKPEQWPNPMYVTYFRKLTEAYGACAILAWKDQSIVGFLPFVPVNCDINLPHCLLYVDAEDMPAVEAFMPTPQSELRRGTLKTHCLSVAPSMHRKGLGSAMVQYLVEWATAHHWREIKGWAFATSDFGWIPDIVFWEKCGFKRGKARSWDEHITNPGFEYSMAL